LQTRLDAGELLLSYTVLDSTVWALAIANSEVKLRRLPISAKSLNSHVG